MANIPSDGELVKAATDAGWLLEVEAVKSLEQAAYDATQGWAYQDPDDDAKSRELDALGWRVFLADDVVGVTVGVRVLVECKQSSSPFAFIGRSRQGEPWPDHNDHVWPFKMVALPTVERPGQNAAVAAWGTLGLSEIPSSPSHDRFRVGQMTKLTRSGADWKADNAGIFDGLVMPLAKALRASQASFEPLPWALPHDSDKSPYRTPIVALHYPVVLTSAPLLCIDATREVPTVTEEPWCTVERHLQTANTSGHFVIDVVNHEHFAEFLSRRIGTFASEIADRVRANPRLATHAQQGMSYDTRTQSLVRK